jgi:hypothetical protein
VTETVQLALIASIAPTLASVGALIVSLLNKRQGAEASEISQAQNAEILDQQASVGKKADELLSHAVATLGQNNKLIAKAEQTDDHTNGKLEQVTKALAEAALKIQHMEQTMEALRRPPRA